MRTKLRVTRGDRLVRRWGVEAENDKDLAGATIRMMFRPSYADDALISLSAPSLGLEITSDVPGNREIEMELTGAQTALGDIQGETLLWDLELTYADTDGPYTVDQGSLTIDPEVTR